MPQHLIYRTVIADDSEEFRDWLRPILESGIVYKRLAQSQGAEGFMPKIVFTIDALRAVLE